MKTTYAPAAPRESNVDHCDNGCRKDTNDTYACQQKACGKDHLCEDCIWSCDDCSSEFCEEHVTRTEDGGFVCAACLVERTERASQIREFLSERLPESVYEPHGSDCGVWMGEACDCLMGRAA